MVSYQYLVNIYRRYFESLMPYPVMLSLYRLGAFSFLKSHMKNMFDYYDALRKQESLDPELEEVLEYLKKDPFPLFPYQFSKEYSNRDVPIYRDKQAGMYYVADSDNKLYFKRGMTKAEVKNRFNALASEQDIRSPHRYLTHECHMIGTTTPPPRGESGFIVSSDDVVADIGAAEGNFSISIINQVKKLFLFEYDTEWLRTLEQTFKPYSSKVVIIDKMVSHRSGPGIISVDDYFSKQPLHFIKADVEGAEIDVLNGARKTIEAADRLKIAFAAYHKHEHADEMKRLLPNFDINFTYGYMHPWTVLRDEPYLVKGVLRGEKNG